MLQNRSGFAAIALLMLTAWSDQPFDLLGFCG